MRRQNIFLAFLETMEFPGEKLAWNWWPYSVWRLTTRDVSVCLYMIWRLVWVHVCGVCFPTQLHSAGCSFLYPQGSVPPADGFIPTVSIQVCPLALLGLLSCNFFFSSHKFTLPRLTIIDCILYKDYRVTQMLQNIFIVVIGFPYYLVFIYFLTTVLITQLCYHLFSAYNVNSLDM